MEKDKKQEKIRVLLANMGADWHDRGTKVIANGLREAGMEVIYTGLFQTPETIISTAIQENVDVIAISIMSHAQRIYLPPLIKLLEDKKYKVPVVTGGIIRDEDIPFLVNIGVTGNYGPGTPISTIVNHIRHRGLESKNS